MPTRNTVRWFDLFKLLVVAALLAAVVLVTPRVPSGAPGPTPTATLPPSPTPAAPAVALGTPVAAAGGLTLNGSGPANSRLRLTLAEQPLGETTVDADGNWSLTTAALSAGQVYMLVVDQLAADGTPIAAARQFITLDLNALPTPDASAPAPTSAADATATPPPVATFTPPPPTLPAPSSVSADTPFSCRFGVGNPLRDSAWADVLNAGWSVDFLPSGRSTARSRYVRLIYLGQQDDRYLMTSPRTTAELADLVAANPGDLWLIGNEPDTTAQDGLLPQLYADAFHDLSTLIKAIDPTALVANAGLVSRTPNRLEYLDIAYETYRAKYGAPMPVDVWNAHLYVLPEMDQNGQPHPQWTPAIGTDGSNGIRESNFDPASCSDPNDNRYCYAEHDSVAIIENQLRAMRSWMAAKGEQNKPLIVSEWSILYPYEQDGDSCFLQDEFGNCFTPERVSRYLSASAALYSNVSDPAIGYPLDGNRLVQSWAWFSTFSAGVGSASNLVQREPAAISADYLTATGRTFAALAAAQPRRPDLTIGAAQISIAEAGGVTLSAIVANRGDVPAGAYDVTFYADATLSSPLATRALLPPLEGCGWRQQTVSLTLPGTIDRFWVQVDSSNRVSESDESDNVASGAR